MDKDNELMLDVGQANEIKLAARRAGATNADLKLLSEGDTFAKILPVLRGFAEVTSIKPIIDLDVDPMIPTDWTVKEHIKGGQFEFDPKRVALYLDKAQQGGGTIVGKKLRQKLKSKGVYNANLLDFLLAHPELIPKKWKGKFIFFWGTIYRDSSGYLCVRCLRWDGDRWGWDYYWLVNDFSGVSPAVVSASN